MKHRLFIGLFVLLALAACRRPIETQNFASLPSTTSPKLSAIDSLMWQRPDSALACLLPFFDTCCAAEYDRHYAHLLLSELLYKNEYAQTNRAELQDAVVYFDSLMQAPEPVGGASKKQNVFLAARAHYINGVGYYEQDSAVPACQEYLKALETMEEGFEERELVGEKARFMALTYTRLSDLFSNYYLHEQTIVFSRLSLFYYQKQETPSWFVARMLCEIGSHYDMMKQLDSTEYYYNKASDALSDTSVLMYRDISALIAFLSYKKAGNGMFAINELERLLSKAENENEYLARCAVIGEIFYHENLLDSALFYLNTVFHNSSNENLKRQDAKLLVEVLKVQGRHSEIHEYAEFLVPYATQDENQSHLKSQLTKLHQDYVHDMVELRHKQQTRKLMKVVGITLSVLLLFAFVSAAFLFINKKRFRNLKRQAEEKERQLESERHSHKMQQAALSDRLKHLKQTEQKALQQDETIKKLQSEFDATSKQAQQFQQAFKNRLLEIYKSSEENRLERILTEFSTTYPQAMDNLRANHPDLTETERNIVVLSFLGFRTKEEAEILGLSPNTVEKYRTNIRKKTENKPFSDLIG